MNHFLLINSIWEKRRKDRPICKFLPLFLQYFESLLTIVQRIQVFSVPPAYSFSFLFTQLACLLVLIRIFWGSRLFSYFQFSLLGVLLGHLQPSSVDPFLVTSSFRKMFPHVVACFLCSGLCIWKEGHQDLMTSCLTFAKCIIFFLTFPMCFSFI